jgi:hypothetical protein
MKALEARYRVTLAGGVLLLHLVVGPLTRYLTPD